MSPYSAVYPLSRRLQRNLQLHGYPRELCTRAAGSRAAGHSRPARNRVGPAEPRGIAVVGYNRNHVNESSHPAANPGEITELLQQLRSGDQDAESKLLPLLYPELRRMAARIMSRERPEHTLQATALVHEAYIRLSGGKDQDWRNRAHFFALASHVMRQVLVDHARRTRSAKRGGAQHRIQLSEAILVGSQDADRVLTISEAMDRLAKWDPRQCRVIEMRFFGGLTEQEIAEVLGVDTRTVKRDWKMAKAWLKGELTKRQVQDDG